MAAPKLSDGNRPIDGVLNNPIAPSDWNDMIDELKNVFKPQYVPAVNALFGDRELTGGPAWDTITADPPYLFCDSGNADTIFLSLPIRSGGSITRVKGLINGASSGGNDGSIRLVKTRRDSSTLTEAQLVSIGLASALDFNLSSTLTEFDVAVDKGSGATEIVVDDYKYYIELTAPDGGGGNEAYVYQVGVMYALGPVTGAT